MNAEAKRVYFTIDGGFLSDFARTMVIEGKWERAIKMLVDDTGVTYEQAIQLLKGEANFVGNAEIGNPNSTLSWETLSPKGKVAKDMKKQLDYTYGTTFKYKDHYWKPYASVQGWCKEDMDFARSYQGPYLIINGDIRSNSRFANGALRSLFYADNHGSDMLVCLNNSPEEISDVLCAKAPMPPIWIDVPMNDPVAHLNALIKAKKLSLSERGSADVEPVFEPISNRKPSRTKPVPKEYEGADDVELTQREIATRSRELTQQFIIDINAAADTAAIRAVEVKYEDAFSHLTKSREQTNAVPHDVWDMREEAFKKARTNIEEMYANRVRAQADVIGGWYELKLTDEDCPDYDPPFIKVPKNAFINWALRGFRFADFGKVQPEWPCVAGSGWKLPMDDPYHTDWMLGAGIPLSETYGRDFDAEDKKAIPLAERVRDASFSAKHDLVEEWTGVEFSILAKGDTTYAYGSVVFAKPDQEVPPGSIAIAPNAGPKYYLAMISANREDERGDRGLLICQTGGQLAHLAVVGREQNCTVLMIPKALAKFRETDRVGIHLDTMKMTIRV